jgi:FemAB-related protein (PEP-CTERM system-associated)
MRVRPVAEGEDAARWDAYVGPRTSTVSDLAAWRRVVRDAYGLRDHFLAAVEGERIVGALGLYEVEHPLFGHYLTTAIFATEGGLHYDDESARDALLAEARAVAARRGVDYLQIRTRDDVVLDGFSVDRHYRTAVLDLGSGAEAVWRRLPSKTRNQVRRGEREGFSFARGHDQLGAFFDVFHRHMRDLGSPAHGLKFYESIVEHLGAHADFLVVREGRALVAGALLFQLNGTAMNLQTVALRPWNRRCPNYLLYWKIVEASCAAGSRWLDLGRSEAGSSQIAFKSNWGSRVLTLRYQYLLLEVKDVPYLDPRNPKYRLAIRAWQKLPVPVTKRLGPHLISGLA